MRLRLLKFLIFSNQLKTKYHAAVFVFEVVAMDNEFPPFFPVCVIFTDVIVVMIFTNINYLTDISDCIFRPQKNPPPFSRRRIKLTWLVFLIGYWGRCFNFGNYFFVSEKTCFYPFVNVIKARNNNQCQNG